MQTIVPAIPKTTFDVVTVAQQRLQSCPYLVLRSVQCRIRNGVLVLSGNVSSFHMKQIAQELVRDMEQFVLIENRLNVSS